jgi:hypothetical protein
MSPEEDYGSIGTLSLVFKKNTVELGTRAFTRFAQSSVQMYRYVSIKQRVSGLKVRYSTVPMLMLSCLKHLLDI